MRPFSLFAVLFLFFSLFFLQKKSLKYSPFFFIFLFVPDPNETEKEHVDSAHLQKKRKYFFSINISPLPSL